MITRRLLKRGTEVTVRAFRDKELRRRVWKDIGKVVFLCTEEHYQRAVITEEDALTVGFPKEDIVEIHESTVPSGGNA